MQQAIITGATGFIGSRLVRMLIKSKIGVLAIGRKNFSEVDNLRINKSKYINYINLDMSEISQLPKVIEKINWKIEKDCVFYNFAWGGVDRLSDLDIDAQIKNVAWSGEALNIAKKINCSKFIHVGSMEEAFADKYLYLDYKKNSQYNRHVVYSLAKNSARDLLKIISQQIDINLNIATNSHVMGPNDDKDSFLQVTLQKLLKGDELIFSTGEQIFDVISVTDCARAYMLIGMNGKKNKEYWIGSGDARALKEYVEILAKLFPYKQKLQFGEMPYNDISLKKSDFSIKSLVKDTGFRPSQTFEDTAKERYRWITKKEFE